MKRSFSCIIFLFCVFGSAAHGGNVSDESSLKKLEKFMRTIITQREAYSIKKQSSANNLEFDLASLKIKNADKIIVGTENHYYINGEYSGAVRTKEDKQPTGKPMKKNGISSRGEKYSFKADVLETGYGDFLINSFTPRSE